MQFRPPQYMSAQLEAETGASVLDGEILAEKASALGRTGREVERSLKELNDCEAGSPERDTLVRAAADAFFNLMVQRELCGLRNQKDVIALYGVPKEVLVRVGVR